MRSDFLTSCHKRKPRHAITLPVYPLLTLLLICCCCCSLLQTISATHVVGNFQPNEFFKLIEKFGFQKAETQHQSFGYIYGNITTGTSTVNGNATNGPQLTLAVLDKESFIDFYSNRSYALHDRERACQRMFSRIESLVYDSDCNPEAKLDFLRHVPCQRGQLCLDEDAPNNVISGHQFTYAISEAMQPRFWYVSLVACYRNRTTCQWHAYNPHIWASSAQAAKQHLSSSQSSSATPSFIHYDIHIVNMHPNKSAVHRLTYEFSFDQQNLLEMYLIFLLIYVVLLPMQIYAVRLQKHPVTKLFTLSLFSEFISLALITVHLIKFAWNGVGMPDLQTAGDILDILSRTTFMLILLLLAKGWAVTRQQISRLGWIILMSIWVPYCAFHVFLYIWDRTEVDIISDVDEYQTWPGWIVLILRTTFMLWFLYELRNTMKYEHSTKKLDFLLHLGASSLVWFIYLPIVAIVALQISPMWRYKLLLGITNAADCLAYCIMTGLLWPNRAGQYLLLAGVKYDGMDELDEFNEAPHIVREREQRRNSAGGTENEHPPNNTNANGGASSIGGTVIHNPGATRADGTHVGFSGKTKGNGSVPGSHRPAARGMVLSTSIPYSMNGDACIDLLEAEDLNAELLTDLNKNSHIVA